MQRTSNEEVLLLEAEFPSLERVVVGIENLRDGLGEGFVDYSAGLVACIEYLEVELLAGLGTPKA